MTERSDESIRHHEPIGVPTLMKRRRTLVTRATGWENHAEVELQDF